MKGKEDKERKGKVTIRKKRQRNERKTRKEKKGKIKKLKNDKEKKGSVREAGDWNKGRNILGI